MAAPSSLSARGLGSPFLCSGLTSVVSTASCAPRRMGNPLTTHSSLLLSVGSTGPTSRSLSKPLSRRPPASLQTRRHIFSCGTARVWSTPALLHAARWSPRLSSSCPHLQRLGPSCSGSRSRLSSSVRNCAGLHVVSSCVGRQVKCAPALTPL